MFSDSLLQAKLDSGLVLNDNCHVITKHLLHIPLEHISIVILKCIFIRNLTLLL